VTDIQDFDSILNICLERLRAGDSVDACLQSYPAHARQLAPLLRLAQRMQSVPQGLAMSPQAFQAGQARMLARAARLRARRPAARPAPFGVGLRRAVTRMAAGMLVVFLALGAGFATVSAASTSLPGSPLYSIKRSSERLVSALAFTPHLQTQVHLAWAGRRLREVAELIGRDGVAYRTNLVAMQNETERALGAAEQSDPEALAAVVVQTEQQQTLLQQLLGEVHHSSRVELEQALAASQAVNLRARAALGEDVPAPGTTGEPSAPAPTSPQATDTPGPPGTIGWIETRAPTSTTEPTQPPAASPATPTWTPTGGLASTPEASASSTVVVQPSVSPSASLTPPAPTSTPQPGRLPTSTPTPLPPTATSRPPVTSTPTPTPRPSATPTATSTPTATATPADTPTPSPTAPIVWDRSSLSFVGQGSTCEGAVWATLENVSTQPMAGSTNWELWYAQVDTPKDGEIVSVGTVPALDAGQQVVLSQAATRGAGRYIFKVYQRPGHPGTGVLWSEEIPFDPVQCQVGNPSEGSSEKPR